MEAETNQKPRLQGFIIKLKLVIFQGEWVHPEIDNPAYINDDELYFYDDWGSIGIDIWQVKSGTIFDNIIITDSIEEAKTHADKNFKPLFEVENELKEKYDKKKKEEEDKKFKESDSFKKEDKEDESDDTKKEEDHDEL